MIRDQVTKAVLLIGLLHASAARATWSIVIADLETKEVAVGTVTCLTGLDLLAIVPVLWSAKRVPWSMPSRATSWPQHQSLRKIPVSDPKPPFTRSA